MSEYPKNMSTGGFYCSEWSPVQRFSSIVVMLIYAPLLKLQGPAWAVYLTAGRKTQTFIFETLQVTG